MHEALLTMRVSRLSVSEVDGECARAGIEEETHLVCLLAPPPGLYEITFTAMRAASVEEAKGDDAGATPKLDSVRKRIQQAAYRAVEQCMGWIDRARQSGGGGSTIEGQGCNLNPLQK